MQITKLDGDKALARLSGVSREVSLMLVEDVQVGDYVLVHAGFAIGVIDEQIAEETLELLEEKYGAREEEADASQAPRISEDSK